MELQTKVEWPKANFEIAPCERMIFVGSCFADNMGRRFADECFRVTVNPYGVMYNPISIGHTVDRLIQELPPDDAVGVVVLTLGTNHIYVLKATDEVVDNCQKRPQHLFDERVMSVGEVEQSLTSTISHIQHRWPQAHIIVTVSPIRYKKYGFHGSQLSKATLLLAADAVAQRMEHVCYFPAYEIVVDQLRDYRFYAEDMIHPSSQAVDYIWERMGDVFFGDAVRTFLREWHPVRAALQHRPFNADSDEYKTFMDKTMLRVASLSKKYDNFAPNFNIKER